MERTRELHFEKKQSFKGDLKIQKAPSRKSDGKPKRLNKIIVKPNDGRGERPYDLLHLIKVKQPTTSAPVMKKLNLTPHQMKHVRCPHHTHNMLCIPNCKSMLKPIKPFKETVQYFKDPSLNFAEVLDSFKDGFSRTGQKSEDTSHADQRSLSEDVQVECEIQLMGTGLINMIDIEQTNLRRKSAAGRDVLNHNERYNNLLSSQRTCSDQVTQTIPGDVDQSVKSQETFIDSDIAVTTTESTGVDSIHYDHQDRCNQDMVSKNMNHSSSNDYLNQFPPSVVVNQMVKHALIIERHLDQNKTKLVHIGRFSNVEEEINYLEKDIREIVDNITMDLLFTFSSDFGGVAIMDWHPGHEYMVAVAYSSENWITNDKSCFESSVCIWNLNNTKNPERVYKLPTRRVISMEFSKWKPYLLLIVYVDGRMVVLDVLRRTKFNLNVSDISSHIVASNHLNDKRIRARCVSWYNYDDDDSESFLCCKEDGKVRKYTVRPPYLEDKLLMKWSPNISVNNFPLFSDQVLLNLVAEDERLEMNDMFYVGTDEGKLHAISQSSKEIVYVYKAHDSLITSFQFSPFVGQLFLTSCFDGTIKIWWERVDKPLFTLGRDAVPVLKSRWHPKLSTVIISIVQSEIHLWDLAQNKSKPYLIQTLPSNERITDFVFSKNGVNLCVGDDKGKVFVFKILTKSNMPTQLQVRLLCKTVLSWKPPGPVCDHLTNLLNPETADRDGLYGQTNTVEKKFELLKNVHPILFKDPPQIKTLAEKLEKLLLTSEKDDATGDRSEQSLNVKNKCLQNILRKLCKCDEGCMERMQKGVQNNEEALRTLLAE